MSIIRQMDSKLANMIAAGEVVDRPASIVKELLENSIDAKATIINVDVTEMGMKSIVVTDNGVGMDFLDAHLAFDRHATSKILDESDLGHIQTLGFRGEALAAISSVSKVTLKTRQKQNEGIQVIYHGGKFVSDGVATLNEGTVVEVTDLFYNTPARFKYIKSEVAERLAIIDIFDRIALAHPSIRFTLSVDGKITKRTFGTNDFYSLIDQIYGSKMTEHMTIFNHMIQKVKITGYLLSPQISRSRKKDISIFVNGRYIRNYRLIQAVIDGYHSYLMTGKYPIALIHLEMDPSLLDVNVHPQKYEVKFVNESILAYAIENAVKDALIQKIHPIPENLNTIQKAKQDIFTPIDLDFGESILAESIANDEKDSNHDQLPKLPDFDYVGVFSGTYILFQNQDALYLMDQHAAAERIRYEHYFDSLAHPNQSVKQLLFENELKLTTEDKTVIRENEAKFNKYGFYFNSNMDLTGLPVWLNESEIDIAIEAMISMLTEKHDIDLSILRDRLAKDISCKGAIKANQSLNMNEINGLVKKLRACKNPYTCPHGRPTVIKLTHYEIERMFKRVI
ncbi:MAG: DNA mismatch repair endonuclease MutL [Acholeplasmataceae bacterium]|nr:DNA mismatch repair endonuclease MutL [Acholeplasmataceae bacterium]